MQKAQSNSTRPFQLWVALLAAVALIIPGFAADTPDPTQEVTLKGVGMCAKCALEKADSCQNVLQVKKGGEKTHYYLVQNKVSKDFHKELCQAEKEITVKGKVEKKDGKLMLTATKIELTKKDS